MSQDTQRAWVRFRDGLEMLLTVPIVKDANGAEYQMERFRTGRPDRIENVEVEIAPRSLFKKGVPLYVEVCNG